VGFGEVEVHLPRGPGGQRVLDRLNLRGDRALVTVVSKAPRGLSVLPDGVGACGPPPTEPECRARTRLAYGRVSRHHLNPVIESVCIPVMEPACGAAGEAALPAVVDRWGALLVKRYFST
jgi:hypothetical protein